MNPLAAAFLAAQGWDLSKYGQNGSGPLSTDTVNDQVSGTRGVELIECDRELMSL